MAGVVTLITEDHRKLEAVFKQLESEPDDVRRLLQQVAELLIQHSKAEQQVVYPALSELGEQFTVAKAQALSDLKPGG
jgi:hemerythrin superfamily protein